MEALQFMLCLKFMPHVAEPLAAGDCMSAFLCGVHTRLLSAAREACPSGEYAAASMLDTLAFNMRCAIARLRAHTIAAVAHCASATYCALPVAACHAVVLSNAEVVALFNVCGFPTPQLVPMSPIHTLARAPRATTENATAPKADTAPHRAMSRMLWCDAVVFEPCARGSDENSTVAAFERAKASRYKQLEAREIAHAAASASAMGEQIAEETCAAKAASAEGTADAETARRVFVQSVSAAAHAAAESVYVSDEMWQ